MNILETLKNKTSDLFDAVRSSISPGTAKIALKSLHVNLESAAGHPIEVFQMVYEKVKDEIYFKVTQPDSTIKKYKYEDRDIIKIIELHSTTFINTGDTLDVVILEFVLRRQPQYLIKAYYTTSTGEQLQTEIPIG